MRITFAMALAAGVSVSAMAQEGVATLKGVASVEDGDGLLFGRVEVRLQGIAAPELDEPMGAESRAGLMRLAGGKEVICHLDGTTAGRSGRPVAVCFVGDLELGEALVEAGMARDCPSYSKGRYADAEAKARNAGNDLSRIYDLPAYC
jgi:endonuclease YncB( thermonuclease family)